MPDIPIPIDPLVAVLSRAEHRAHGNHENRAWAEIRIALTRHTGRALGCTDLRGSYRACSTCRVPECPHGRQGGL